MARLVVCLALVVACGSYGSTSDALSSTLQCEGTFDQQVNRSCTSAGDCVLLTHPDCCGPIAIGVNAEAQTQPAEMSYETCMNAACGARGCGHPLEAQDGKTPSAGQSIVATCIARV